MKILWIPHTGWHIPQRAHLFCRALAERHEVHVANWITDFSLWRDYVSRRYLANFVYQRSRDGNITVHRIPRFSPALCGAVRRINACIYGSFVRHIVERHRIDAVVGTFVVPPPRAPRLVVDLFDDNVAFWRSLGRMPEYADEIEDIERAYLRTADAVVAASSVLVDKARASGARGPVCLIPNGVDLQSFTRGDAARARAWIGAENGPLVGTIGNYGKPVELAKLLDAARILPDVTFLIAGRGAALPEARERAQREGLSNVRFLGYVPPENVADVIGALDVGLCPYSKSPADDARSPMRLLTFAADGLPTVCTGLEEVKRMNFSNVVLVDDDAHSFADGIRQALTLPRARPPQITAYDLPRLVKHWEAVLSGRFDTASDGLPT